MGLLTKEAQDQILALLVNEGLADASAVQQARIESEKVKKPILAILASQNAITDESIAHATAVINNIPYVNLKNVRIEQETLLILPRDVVERSMAIPLGELNGQLVVAMLDTTNVQAIDYLAQVAQKPIKTYMTSTESVQAVIEQYKGDFSSVRQAVKATNSEIERKKASGDIKIINEDSPISKALNQILEYAAKSKASDIHIEPTEESLVIRCRIDGVLRQIMELPKTIEPALISRIKILASLKIDEHRIPQDGQFTVMAAGKEIDLRIAISPVVWGEQVVIRLLDKSGTTMKIDDMGMTGRSLRVVLEGISRPNGMILTSGPTGSGKSTTLYALISQIKNEAINIVTLEDPVEYKMDGVNQIQVNEEAGLTFASGLRSILRQDPDVVMVGEIRDSETANLAVQAALTGHLVFSTLHTNSAAGILPRLLDMDIEPFLIASTLNTVIGQRLVRRVSSKRETYQSSEIETNVINEVMEDLLPKTKDEVEKVSKDLGYPNLPLAKQTSYTLVKGIEDRENPGGYSGRAGLYEAITVDEDIQKLIISHATANDIMKVAKSKGVVTMRQDGILKALTGITTIEEVNRVASDLA